MAKAHKKTSVKEGTIKKGMEFAMQIWLAGLGAFVKAQEEGSKLFESLVKEGEAMQARSKKTCQVQAGRQQSHRDLGQTGAYVRRTGISRIEPFGRADTQGY